MFKAAIQFLLKTVWALDEATYHNMKAAALQLKAESAPVVKARGFYDAGDARPYEVINGVAVLPIKGVLTRNEWCWWGSNCNIDTLTRAANRLAMDAGVTGVLLDIDSPGGETDGIAEAADALFALRGKKTLIAYARGSMCSAAYWLGSQASQIYAGKASPLGNIGVYTSLIDSSKAAEEAGLKVHLLKAGDLKGIGEPGVAISAEQLAEVQNFVNSIYDVFVGAVAQGRGLKAAQVKAFADGRTVLGAEALELGLIDGVESIDATMARLAPKGSIVQANAGGTPAPQAKGKTKIKESTIMKAITCPHCDKEFEQEEDKKEETKAEGGTPNKEEKEIGAEDKKEEKKEEKKDAEALRAEGVKAEREYRKAFTGILQVAKISGKAAENFEQRFYGRDLEDVKFMASNFLQGATPAAGDGPGPMVTLPEQGAPEGGKKTTAAEATEMWNDATLRRAFGYCGSLDPKSEEFIKARERYVKAATA